MLLAPDQDFFSLSSLCLLGIAPLGHCGETAGEGIGVGAGVGAGVTAGVDAGVLGIV